MAACFSVAIAQVGAIEPADVLVFTMDPVMLRPRVALSETYNDNIFSLQNGEGDFLTTLSPGLNLQVGKSGLNFISLDYTLNENFYANRSDLNAGEHNFGLNTRFFGSKLVVTGTDRVQLLSSPIGLVQVFSPFPVGPVSPPTGGGDTGTAGGGGGAPSSTVVGETPGASGSGEALITEERNVKRTVFFDSYNIGYRLGEKTGAYLQGLHSSTDYERGIQNIFDIDTLQATAGFGYQAFPKTSVFGEIFYGQTTTTPNTDASKIPDLSFVGGSFGVRGNLTEKLSGVVKAGYEIRRFSDNSSAPSAPVANLSLNYRFSNKTSLSLDYARLYDVSIQFAKVSYTANSLTAQLSQAIGSNGKWRASLGGSYSTFEYESGSSPYNRYSANFGLAYQVQVWLTANLGYSFDRISYVSSGSAGYDINRISLSLALGY